MVCRLTEEEPDSFMKTPVTVTVDDPRTVLQPTSRRGSRHRSNVLTRDAESTRVRSRSPFFTGRRGDFRLHQGCSFVPEVEVVVLTVPRLPPEGHLVGKGHRSRVREDGSGVTTTTSQTEVPEGDWNGKEGE